MWKAKEGAIVIDGTSKPAATAMKVEANHVSGHIITYYSIPWAAIGTLRPRVRLMRRMFFITVRVIRGTSRSVILKLKQSETLLRRAEMTVVLGEE